MLAIALHKDFAVLVVSQFGETWHLAELEVDCRIAGILASIRTTYDRSAANMEMMAATIADVTLSQHMKLNLFK